MNGWIEFLNPGRLWWLVGVAVLAAAYALGVWLRRSRNPGGPSSLDLVIPRERPWQRHLAVGLAMLSLVSLVVAYARPKQAVDVPRERATIMVVIDVSLSMQARDVEPDRLAAAKQGAADFVNSLPRGFNVGVVSFAGSAQILVPPGEDRGRALAAIQGLQLQPSTAIGEGIHSALDALAQLPPDPQDPDAEVPARIVLLSDGKTTIGRASDDAAEVAKARKVPVYTIAYGTADGYIEIDGRREPVPVDHAELAEVAKISGGKPYKAASVGELKEVYADIGSSVGYEKVDQEVTSRYAGFGLLFAILAALGVISLAARWP